MFDHVSIKVSDIGRSKAFYVAALAPLGFKIVKDIPERSAVAFGVERPQFWVKQGETSKVSLHFAFSAKTREAVDAFHAAALVAGGMDNGAPGPRPKEHSPHCYAAFVFDPDGNNVEADCHIE
ncbi:VOC family protein [Candidatus Parcubacteria bacterium]|nr:MAG: VOC family protein [Candidatus Parcubacteria bacterium]